MAINAEEFGWKKNNIKPSFNSKVFHIQCSPITHWFCFTLHLCPTIVLGVYPEKVSHYWWTWQWWVGRKFSNSCVYVPSCRIRKPWIALPRTEKFLSSERNFLCKERWTFRAVLSPSDPRILLNQQRWRISLSNRFSQHTKLSAMSLHYMFSMFT